MSLICPKQSTPISNPSSNLFCKSWWLFFSNIASAFSASPQSLRGFHADRPDASDHPNATYFETDRTVTYQSVASTGKVTTVGTVVSWVSGHFFLTSWVGSTIVINGASYVISAVASVISLTIASTAGNQTEVPYEQRDFTWRYSYGYMEGSLSPDQKPTDLGDADIGFEFEAFVYVHRFRWSSAGWLFARGDGSEHIVMGPPQGGPPQGGLWGLCDGTAYDCAQADGTLVSRTTVDLRDRFIVGAETPGTVQDASRATWETTAKTETEALHTHGVTVPGESYQTGAGAIQTVGADGGLTSDVGSAHYHDLEDGNAQLKVPSIDVGLENGVPPWVGCTWYIRR